MSGKAMPRRIQRDAAAKASGKLVPIFSRANYGREQDTLDRAIVKELKQDLLAAQEDWTSGSIVRGALQAKPIMKK